jgi:hypothetical protein
MRRFLFWHRHSANDRPTLISKRSATTARFRKLAFQVLEPRDLKTVDTTTMAALPAVSKSDAAAVGIPPMSSVVMSGDSASTTVQAPTAPTSADTGAPINPSVQSDGGPTAAAAQSVVPAGSGVSSPLPVNSDNGTRTAGPTTTVTTVSAAAIGGGETPTVSPTTVSPVGSTAVPTSSQTSSGPTAGSNSDPSLQGPGTTQQPIGSPATYTADSAQAGYGGAADGSGGTTDGYRATADEYGGDSGYGGYGGGAPYIDDVTVTNSGTNTDFNGQVSGEANLAGATVTFGGQLSGYSTTVDANNRFILQVPSSPPIQGTITVEVTDSHGVSSNVITIYVS